MQIITIIQSVKIASTQVFVKTVSKIIVPISLRKAGSK
jgi:hypothetical protein